MKNTATSESEANNCYCVPPYLLYSTINITSTPVKRKIPEKISLFKGEILCYSKSTQQNLTEDGPRASLYLVPLEYRSHIVRRESVGR